MSVVTPTVRTTLRGLVASSQRRHFLHDPEGIELSNQAALMRELVVTIQTCLEPDLAAIREAARTVPSADPRRVDTPGIHLIASIAQYEEILDTLLDMTSLIERGRMSTAWTLLAGAAERLRILTALDSPSGNDVARQLAAASVRTRARFTAAAADNVDLGLSPAVESAGIPAQEPGPLTLPAPTPDVVDLLELVELGTATSRGGDLLAALSLDDSPPETDYDHLATIGGYQFHLVLEIIRSATDSLCGIAGPLTTDEIWSAWADDIHEALEFAWDCI
ncbi:hypothetical protein [Rhodococcus spongiicola]|uniref:Uncharacterized protein n=1 Tax=Rhodococcus spongiicola TaxID=2487352 RepID=A0A438B638_9NOCA|nr:hypothetical protein [Rhodococcus spongiicola]RVW06402.1 hypothetical protein EF834_02955 [Rhodococcus spongiicola]